MFQLTNNVIVILAITTLINSFAVFVSWQRRKTKGGLYIALSMLSITFWTFIVGLDYGAIPIPLKVFFEKLEYTFHNITITLLALFALTYSGYKYWLKKNIFKVFFWGIPISNILLTWTNDWHKLIWNGFTRSEIGNNAIIFNPGLGYVWVAISGYLIVLIIILSLWNASRKGSELSRRQARLLFITTIFSVASNAIYILGDQRLRGVDWTPIIFSVLGIIFILVLYGTRLLDLVPIARYTMIEQMNDCVLVLDEHNRLADFNLAAQEIFEISYSDLGKHIKTVLASWPKIIELFSLDKKNTSQIIISHASEVKEFDTHLTLFTDDLGKIYGKLMIFSDVTKHHQIEQSLEQRLFEIQELNKNLQESQAQVVAQQRKLAKQEERKRLGRDMHDSVNQSIHSLMLFSETLGALLKKNHINKALSVTERIQESGRQALKEIRLLVFETQSQDVDEITDLITALQERFSFVENRVGVQAEIIQDGTLAYIPSEWNENLFWIIIEALNNSLKHAQINKIKVFFRYKNKHLEIEIIDKGVGFDSTLSNGGGMGMRTMQERAELIGGHISVVSSPGHGTSVSFSAEIKE